MTISLVFDSGPAISQGLRLPRWSPYQSLKFMERNKIGAAILSLGSSATSVSKDRSGIASFCREMNDYTAFLREQRPSRFGFFATLPSLNDSQACVDEIRYSIDVLKTDGINLLTSYGGKYLGHPDFRGIWNEMNKRAAVIFVHPGLEGMDGAIREPQSLLSPISIGPTRLLERQHTSSRQILFVITETVRSSCLTVVAHYPMWPTGLPT